MAETGKITLYSYWRSTCSQRVRIALNLKGLDYEYKSVNLLKGEHFDPEFEKLNPVKYVPALVDGDFVLADSFAIILYLEDKYPHNPLLPQDLKMKALNIQIASIVSSSIQPLQNTNVIKYIEEKLDSEAKLAWVQLYINNGFADHLASRGVIALPGTRFLTTEQQQQRWIIRPSQRRNPQVPTSVNTRALLDGSISLQFQGYTTVPPPEPVEVNEDDMEQTQEILGVLYEVEQKEEINYH